MIANIGKFAEHFAVAIKAVDSERPVWKNARTGVSFQPGIGPHSEAATCKLVTEQMKRTNPDWYASLDVNVPYAKGNRTRCDIADELWAIEVKMLRLFGDNGKPNDNLLMHILSPYPQHRSALTDCEKLTLGRPRDRLGILIYAFESADWPMIAAISAFETLARAKYELTPMARADFSGLVHPVHASGAVFAWEIVH
ncbi:MAG: hypothetical protein AB7J35_13745 [Dehalococcoidia bacterium]